MPTTTVPDRWLLLIYKVPSHSSRARVAVWRDLKRLGALYLQQAVCVLPDVQGLHETLEAVRGKIADMGGTSFFATLTDLAEPEREQLVAGFLEQSQKDYAEIIEECDTKFVKEIEFERFRGNYTFEEAEEIQQDLDKLRRWLARVIARDWIGAATRGEAEQRIAVCAQLLEDFEADVYRRSGQEDTTDL